MSPHVHGAVGNSGRMRYRRSGARGFAANIENIRTLFEQMQPMFDGFLVIKVLAFFKE